MATNSEVKFLGMEGAEQLVATVKNLLTDKVDTEYVDNAIASVNEYILDIDYETLLAFDTTQIVFNTNSTSVLGQAILGQMVLA